MHSQTSHLKQRSLTRKNLKKLDRRGSTFSNFAFEEKKFDTNVTQAHSSYPPTFTIYFHKIDAPYFAKAEHRTNQPWRQKLKLLWSRKSALECR
jgi:hypothetical protein